MGEVNEDEGMERAHNASSADIAHARSKSTSKSSSGSSRKDGKGKKEKPALLDDDYPMNDETESVPSFGLAKGEKFGHDRRERTGGTPKNERSRDHHGRNGTPTGMKNGVPTNRNGTATSKSAAPTHGESGKRSHHSTRRLPTNGKSSAPNSNRLQPPNSGLQPASNGRGLSPLVELPLENRTSRDNIDGGLLSHERNAEEEYDALASRGYAHDLEEAERKYVNDRDYQQERYDAESHGDDQCERRQDRLNSFNSHDSPMSAKHSNEGSQFSRGDSNTSITNTPGGMKSVGLWPFRTSHHHGHNHRQSSFEQDLPSEKAIKSRSYFYGMFHHGQHANAGPTTTTNSSRGDDSKGSSSFPRVKRHADQPGLVDSSSPYMVDHGDTEVSINSQSVHGHGIHSSHGVGSHSLHGAPHHGHHASHSIYTRHTVHTSGFGSQPPNGYINGKRSSFSNANHRYGSGVSKTRSDHNDKHDDARHGAISAADSEPNKEVHHGGDSNTQTRKMSRLFRLGKTSKRLEHTLFTPFTATEHAEHYRWGDRLVPRDSPFCQSQGFLAVDRQIPGYLGGSLRSLYYMNLFHSILDLNLKTHVFLIASIYITFWCVVAACFLGADQDCHLNLEGNFTRAYMLALETTVTIGYGVPDPYMNECWQGPIILTVATLVSMILDGILIGLIFMTLTNPQRRAATVVFTDKAIIKLVDGKPHLVFQVAEIRKHALLEAHIRCYCFKHCEVINPLTGKKSKSRVLQQFPMRLQAPDDELGGMLFLATPFLVVHRIDEWSPLYDLVDTTGSRRKLDLDVLHCAGENHASLRGRSEWTLRGNNTRGMERQGSISSKDRSNRGKDPTASDLARIRKTTSFETLNPATQLCSRVNYMSPPQRMCDAERGMFNLYACPYCGDQFPNREVFYLHLETNVGNGTHPEQVPSPKSRQENILTPTLKYFDVNTRPEKVNLLSEDYFEILAIVEGIEPFTSSTVQARHSYSFAQDIVLNGDFMPCTFLKSDRTAMVDFGKFHQIVQTQLYPPEDFDKVGEGTIEREPSGQEWRGFTKNNIQLPPHAILPPV